MRLVPAIRLLDGTVVSGAPNDSHVTIIEEKGLPSNLPDSAHGFTPGGKLWLSRKQALGWIKKYEPQLVIKLRNVPPEGLHSEHYAAAKGIKQRDLSDSIDLSKKRAIVFDRGGLYTYWAQKHGEYYANLDYYMPDAAAYPESPRAQIGKGLSEIRRITDKQFFAQLQKEKCTVLFPDCYDGAFQNYLRSQGHDVFGSGLAEELEYNKKIFLDALTKYGLYVPFTKPVCSLDEMLEYLEGKGEKWVKPLFRGDFETRKYDNMAQFKTWIDQEIRPKLAGTSRTFQALIQSPIKSDCEIGYDGEYVDGEYCEDHIQGIEEKDAFFISMFKRRIADPSRRILDKFAPALNKYGTYRGGLSTEQREPAQAFIDLTARIGSPPGEIQCEQIVDYPKVTYLVSRGIMPKKKAKALYGAEIILTSDWYSDHELTVQFPKEYEQNVKLKCHYKSGRDYKIVPNGNGAFFGAVVAWDNNWEKAAKKAVEIAKSINTEGYSFTDNPAAFENIAKSMEAAEKYGYDFTSEDK